MSNEEGKTYTTNLIGLRKLRDDIIQLSEDAKAKETKINGYLTGVSHAYKKTAQWMTDQIELIEKGI